MIDLSLDSDEIVAVVKAMNAWPAAEIPPGGDGWWSLQEKIKQAIEANPEAAKIINEKLDGR